MYFELALEDIQSGFRGGSLIRVLYTQNYTPLLIREVYSIRIIREIHSLKALIDLN